ncbi:uncharacterized protein LOC142768989 [Rhipicephalus microplus]|uniref:uncharacterized protein LOC142768989 n=1 Tax=Rhipicephalus microplus TaxID=6941 RepID=UPI003F6D077A
MLMWRAKFSTPTPQSSAGLRFAQRIRNVNHAVRAPCSVSNHHHGFQTSRHSLPCTIRDRALRVRPCDVAKNHDERADLHHEANGVTTDRLRRLEGGAVSAR